MPLGFAVVTPTVPFVASIAVPNGIWVSEASGTNVLLPGSSTNTPLDGRNVSGLAQDRRGDENREGKSYEGSRRPGSWAQTWWGYNGLRSTRQLDDRVSALTRHVDVGAIGTDR